MNLFLHKWLPRFFYKKFDGGPESGVTGYFLIDSNDSSFVVCWTSDGKDSGGTGQALRIARDRNIPVYNLYNKGVYEECLEINY